MSQTADSGRDQPDLRELHEPYEQLLRRTLLQLSPRGAALALDLGCGSGLKSAWLATLLAPNGLLVGADLDQGALRKALTGAEERPGRVGYLAADAAQLPLRDCCVELAWCIAALRLFAEPAAALRELRRVLRPGGTALIVVAGQRWVRLRPWPPALAEALVGAPLPSPADGLGEELLAEAAAAGLHDCTLCVMLAGGNDPLGAALPLADWNELRPYATARLAPADLAACTELAATEGDPEPATVLFFLTARA